MGEIEGCRNTNWNVMHSVNSVEFERKMDGAQSEKRGVRYDEREKRLEDTVAAPQLNEGDRE